MGMMLNAAHRLIRQRRKFFGTITWTGDGATSGTRTITGNFKFVPDVLHNKDRNATTDHRVFDVLRDDFGSIVHTSTTGIGGSNPGYVTPVEGGFELDNTVATYLNVSGRNYVMWCYKVGGEGVVNNDGSIETVVSVSPDGSMSVALSTGTGAIGTIGTGLPGEVEFITTRNIEAISYFSAAFNIDGVVSDPLYLNLPNGVGSNQRYGSFGASTVQLTAKSEVNQLDKLHVHYMYRSVPGTCKIGKYNGDTTDYPEVNCGFPPSYLMVKRLDASGDYEVVDAVRDNDGTMDSRLFINTSGAEDSGAGELVVFTDNGFVLDTTNADWNADGGEYAFVARA